MPKPKIKPRKSKAIEVELRIFQDEIGELKSNIARLENKQNEDLMTIIQYDHWLKDAKEKIEKLEGENEKLNNEKQYYEAKLQIAEVAISLIKPEYLEMKEQLKKAKGALEYYANDFELAEIYGDLGETAQQALKEIEVGK